MLAVMMLLYAGIRELQQLDEVGVVQAENRPRISHGGIHHDVDEPFIGRDDFWAFVPAFPWLRIESLFLADFQQRIAGE